jgi:hypothetical protein
MRIVGFHKFLALALAAAVSVPAIAEAGRRGGRSSGPRMSPGKVHRSGGARPGRTTRPRVRDHRGTTVRPPPRGDRPYWRHRHYYYRPYWGFGYWPYYGYHDGYYATYYGSPAYTEAVAPPAPRPQPRVAVGVHVGRLDGDRSADVGIAGLSLRWRGAMFEGEVELGRRSYDDTGLEERSLAATLYLNLGNRDAFHPYLLGGVGALEGDRVFGAIGAGLALPVASRLTLAGDLRAGSVSPRELEDHRIDEDAERTFEGRLGLILDF